AEDGIRDRNVTGVQTCALPIFMLIGIDKEGNWHLNDQSAYLLNADNPQLIQLNKSNEHIAIVPGSSDHQLIRSANADTIDQLDVIFPIVHGTSGEDGSL